MPAKQSLLMVGAAAALLGFGLAGAAEDPPATVTTTVAPLTVTPEQGVAPPDVGPGAPRLSPAEIRAIGEEQRFCGRETPTARIQALRLAQQIPSIQRAAARFDGRIMLNPYSAEENSERGAALLVRTSAREAEDATAAAQAARRTAASSGDPRVVETEMARQQAVNKLVAAQSILTEIKARRADADRDHRQGIRPIVDMNRRAGAVIVSPAAAYADLGLARIGAEQAIDSLVVRGAIVNTRSQKIAVPPLRVTAFDAKGFPLKSNVIFPDRRASIAPGADQEFAFALKPAPRNAATVTVTFGQNEALPLRTSGPPECRI